MLDHVRKMHVSRSIVIRDICKATFLPQRESFEKDPLRALITIRSRAWRKIPTSGKTGRSGAPDIVLDCAKVPTASADIAGMDPSAIALQGLEMASAQLDAAAAAIAGASAASASQPHPVDSVSLSEEMVALMSAQNLFATNVAVLKTADQTQANVLNVLA